MAATNVGLKRIERQTAVIEIKGTTPLIVHAWSEKARRMMLDAQMGKKNAKEPKNPEADFNDSRYRFADGSGDGFPIMGFKTATVQGGARVFNKSVKMTELRQNFNFLADGLSDDGVQLARLIGSEPIMREDMVRLNGSTADIRYRAEYRDWSAVLRIQFVPNLIDLGSVVALVDAGGTNGVGEWRPEKNGSFGTYEVAGEDVE